MYMYSGAYFFNTLSGQTKQMRKSKSTPQLQTLAQSGSAYSRTKQWVMMAGPSDVFVLSLDGVLVGRDGSQASKSAEGLIDALASTTYPFYIVSSQSTSTASDAVAQRLKVEMPVGSPRLFAGLASADKFTQALREIQKRPVCQDYGATMHFLAGSDEVARAVAEADDLKKWKVYLADWSGLAQDTLKSARAMSPRVQVVRQKDLLELLKWGVLMGVDDGCEPEPDEVREGVMKDFGATRNQSLSEQSSE